jgi:hypothetical protein
MTNVAREDVLGVASGEDEQPVQAPPCAHGSDPSLTDGIGTFVGFLWDLLIKRTSERSLARPRKHPSTCGFECGRCWVRTSDPCVVRIGQTMNP